MVRELPGYTLRAATPADESFLWEMLYQAIHVSEGAVPPPRALLQDPSLAHYVADWGKRPGDLGIIAMQEERGEAVGAVWLRLFTADDPGWGYVDAYTPELSISVTAGQRGQGLGRALIERLVEMARGQYPALALSVDPHNAAFRLYQRLGFRVVGMSGTSVTMRKDLTTSAEDAQPTYLIRSFQREMDLPRLARFGMDETLIDPVQAAAAEAALREQMNWLGHDPEQDRWVVTAPGNPDELIAHAFVRTQTQERSYGYIEVLPAWRRHGIGSALLACLRAQASAKRTNQLILNAAMDNQAGHDFLRHHGFQVAGHIRQLVAPADIDVPSPVLPPGFSLRTLANVQDLATLAAVQNRCYHDMWGHVENTPGAMNEERLKEFMVRYPHSFVAEGIFMLFAPDGEAVGVCYGRAGAESANPAQKTVDSPGVAPEYRHLQLQRPLVLATLHWLRQRYGSGVTYLETYGDSDAAIALYQELGFVLEPSKHWIDYRLPI